jgi:S1-C subfamily serine protease
MQVAALTPELAREYEYARAGGVVISDVVPGGAAWRKGLLQLRGWRIVRADREEIAEVGQFQRVLAAKRAGEILSLALQSPDGSNQRLVNLRVPG